MEELLEGMTSPVRKTAQMEKLLQLEYEMMKTKVQQLGVKYDGCLVELEN